MKQDMSRKYMSIKEFRDKGYLQEVNRLFFHRLGLALEIIIEARTGDMRLGGIWDSRDDSEGLLFSYYDQEKAHAIGELLQKASECRSKLDECDEEGIQINETR